MLNKKIGLIALLASLVAGDVLAGTLTSYSIGDVLICFRKSGGGGNDLVVDAGPISTFTNATANQRIAVSAFSGAQLAVVGTNNASWSAFTWYDDTVSPNWTLFVSRARTLLDKQTSPWQAKSGAVQQNSGLAMQAIPPGAKDNSLFNGLNTATAVIEPDASSGNQNYLTGQSYHTALDPNNTGDNNFGAFSGNPENTTLANFTTSGQVVRSDFYQIPPTGSGPVQLLGYFELATNGVMTYVAYPSAVPVIKSISVAGTTVTINYTTGLYGTYTLRGTNTLSSGVAIINWPSFGTLTSGDTATHSISFTDTNPNEFYTITAQ